MNYSKVFLGIFVALAASRFIPHPPNFTSLIALSFYIPAIFGRKYIAAVILSFFLTDLVIGFHSVTLFTWGSVLIIGLIAKFFTNSISMRIFGPLLGAIIFFIPGMGFTMKNIEEATKAAKDRAIHLNQLKKDKNC